MILWSNLFLPNADWACSYVENLWDAPDILGLHILPWKKKKKKIVMHIFSLISQEIKVKVTLKYYCQPKHISNIFFFFFSKNFLKQPTYIRYVIPNLSKFIQINMLTSTEYILQRILWNLKRAWN